MPSVRLRTHLGINSESDIELSIQDRTYDYLMTSTADEIRVSAYVEANLPIVNSSYAELFVSEECGFLNTVRQVSPGSRTRKVQLPGEMKAGEQLTVVVARKPR